MNEQHYRADLEAKGYEPPLTKHWQAGLVNDDHEHDRDLYLLILDGAMHIAMRGETLALGPGDTCEVPARLPHVERVGAAGVRFLVATRAPGR